MGLFALHAANEVGACMRNAVWMLVLLALAACEAKKKPMDSERKAVAVPRSQVSAQYVAQQIVGALGRKDYATVSRNASAGGVRISPHAKVDKRSDVVLSAQELSACATDPKIRVWGTTDGKGDAMSFTCAGYFAKYVYSADFASITPTDGMVKGHVAPGETDLAATYSNAKIYEYYIAPAAGKPEQSWAILRIVLMQEGHSGYKIVGLSSDRWRI